MLAEMIMAQAGDPFRIGLLVALFATMWRTRAATGTLMPLVLGAGFVAVLVPMTVAPQQGAALWWSMATGFGVNLVWLAVIWAVWAVIQRQRG